VPRPRSVLGAGCFALLCACQAVFGDFDVTSAPAEEPAPALGAACEPGAYRCTNELLERCNDDRSGFVVEQVCASPAECNLNARTCRACEPGEIMCRDNVLERCDANATWVADPPCDPTTRCSVTSDRRMGECKSACQAGKHECDGPRLLRCSASRDRTEVVALCENEEHCDAQYADELAQAGKRGACRAAACEPDEFRCDGATLQHCSIDRTRLELHATCDSPDLCNSSQGVCAACSPGAIECNGAELRRCSDSSTWETLAICDAPALCDEEAGSCSRGSCSEPGALRCGGGDLPALEVCSDGLEWVVAEPCATRALCSVSAGRCLTPACDANETRCSGSRHEGCSSDRTRWDAVTACPPGTHCTPNEGCVPSPCVEDSFRCNGAGLERCVSGSFQEVARCETAALCDDVSVPGRCVASSCTKPFTCYDGGILRGCNPRNGEYEFRTCRSPVPVCDENPAVGTGQPECDECIADDYSCNGSDLRRCSSDGKRTEKVATCPTGMCNADTTPPTCM
jgi:hypothetical protein